MLSAWVRRWVICMALWLVLTSTVARNQVVTGLIAAALAATAWHVVARVDGLQLRVPGHSWRWYAWAPLRVLSDTWRALHALVLQIRGRVPHDAFHEVALPHARTPAERDGRDALLVLLVSVSPNHYVVDIDDDRDTALLHALVPQPAEHVEDVLRTA